DDLKTVGVYLKQRGWPVSHCNGAMERMIIERRIEQGESWTHCWGNEGVQIIANASSDLEAVGKFPFVLNVEAKPVLCGIAADEIAGKRVVPIVESITEKISRPQLSAVLPFDVVSVAAKDRLGDAISVSNRQEGRQHR